MITAPLLLTLAVAAAACTGCAGLKAIVQSGTESIAATAETTDPLKTGTTAQSAKLKSLELQNKEPEPRVIHGAPALQVAATQENCLALNVFYEAGVEDDIGKMAIANVTINRLHTGRWGNNICDVVYAQAQFSWTAAGKLPKPSGSNWEKSRKAARKVIEGKRIESLGKALYYHASYVKPYWKKPAAKVQQIGKHIFYSGAKVAKPAADAKLTQTAAAN